MLLMSIYTISKSHLNYFLLSRKRLRYGNIIFIKSNKWEGKKKIKSKHLNKKIKKKRRKRRPIKRRKPTWLVLPPSPDLCSVIHSPSFSLNVSLSIFITFFLFSSISSPPPPSPPPLAIAVPIAKYPTKSLSRATMEETLISFV